MSLTAIAAATSLLAACGGGSGGGSGSSASSTTVQGVVANSSFVAGSSTDPQFLLTAYKNAKVCVDANNNGKCDSSENPVVTDSNGTFSINMPAGSALIADIGTDATSIVDSSAVTQRNVFRISADQIKEQGNATVISPLSAEVVRMMDENHSSYTTEKQSLATRIGVPVADVLGNPTATVGAELFSMLAEGYRLSERYAYAIKKLDRGDKYPDDLAVAGGDPRLNGLQGVSTATVNTSPDTRTAITFAQSQQAAFNIEGIPRYDHVFIVMLENKATLSIKGSTLAPNINRYLSEGNQLTSYFATGNPSEPNYTALGGADDFGITDDSQWNCDAGAVQDTEPTAANFPVEMAKSPFTSPCTQAAAVNHNIVGKRNLFNALTNAGLNWRTYSESMNPGQDVRVDSIADTAVTAADKNDSSIVLPMPAGLYKTKHHPGMAYQNVRNAKEFTYSNRTLGGGQWDATLLANSTAYPTKKFKDINGNNTTKDWTIDQFSDDLQSGNIGAVNFVVPDQCDDMHGISVKTADGTKTATDCSSVANNVDPSNPAPIITRGDKYVDYLVKKIEASPIWTNPKKRVAIVLMFDEGNATGGVNNSCCGWNPGNATAQATNGKASQALNEDGTVAAAINNYTKGNHGHGESIYGILTNQAAAPKHVSDSDAYSHFSFVRTLQDMFGLSDPADDTTYMNRSKYTEKFIAENINNLPEYTGTSDTHFNAVRPINHAFKAPATYTQIQSPDVNTPVQTGPDNQQTNVWAVKS